MIESWPGSAAAWQRARLTMGAGVSTGLRSQMKPHPIFFSHGQGSKLWDVDGNSYIDFVLGWGPSLLGHCHPRIVEAVSAQLHRGHDFGSGHHLEYEVAEAVCERIPGCDRILWSNTGTEANQIALRLARAATGRRRFIKFAGHYHGWMDSVLLSYRTLDPTGRPALGSLGQNPSVQDDVAVVEWGRIDQIRAILASPTSDIAAILCEPVLVNSGLLSAPSGFLEELRDLCTENGVILIFDEVITGFRIAAGGAVERFGVVPDLVTLAKAIAGGFTLAAVGGRAGLIDLVERGVVHAGTYNGSPIGLAAASATLAELSTPDTYLHLEERSAQLSKGMREIFASQSVTASIHHIGPILQCVPGLASTTTFAEFMSGDWKFYDVFSVELLRRGIFVLPGGRWYLSTVHDATNIDDSLKAIDAALRATVNAYGTPIASPIAEA
jgi:glutamate-1-semialdehyde 2,1-aminomutase